MRVVLVAVVIVGCEGWESTPPFPDCETAGPGCAAGCDICMSAGETWLMCDGDRVEVADRCDAGLGDI